MKYNAKFPLGAKGCWILVMGCTFSSLVTAVASPNPYSGIVDRNSFGLRPPTPEAKPEPPPPAASKIKLQGLTTILGRKQVLLKTTVPARPPEFPSPRELSMVLSEGQRDGEVEVIEINPVAGTVKFRNAGKIESLNMKDDADKPAPGVATPAVGGGAHAPGRPAVPGVHPTAPPAASPGGAATVTPFGVSETGATPNIPARTLRGSAANMGGPTAVPANGGSANETLAAQQAVAAQRTPEENVILYEANRLRREASGNSFIRFPPHPALKGLGGGQ